MGRDEMVHPIKRFSRRPIRRAAAASVLGAAALLAMLTLALGCAGAQPGKPLAVGATAALPRPSASHVVIIVMENAEYDEVIGSSQAPYVNALARRYGPGAVHRTGAV